MQGLACPNCGAAGLTKNAQGNLACGSCKTNYPRVGSTYFLYPDPGAALLDWRNRFNRRRAELAAEIERTADVPSKLDSVRERGRLTAEHLNRHAEELDALLRPLQPGEPVAPEVYAAMRQQLPEHHSIDSYMTHIFRDWSWGDEENKAVLEIVAEALKAHTQESPARVLVLGSGAGRLAFDLHRHLDADLTVALDSNPLLSMIAGELFDGRQVELTEFARAPIDQDHIAQARTLQIEQHAAQPGALGKIHSVCGDAMRAPVNPGDFDLLVTPWLLDVLDTPLPQALAQVASYLAPGAIWLMHGSVAFESREVEGRWTVDDLPGLASTCGFDVLKQADHELPYLHSPLNRGKRYELVHTLIAQRTEMRLKTGAEAVMPSWLQHTSEVVPLSEEFRTQLTTTRIHAFIMGLIDGKRSINDMAEVLEEQRLMPAQQGVQAVRQFLNTMHEEAMTQRRTR